MPKYVNADKIIEHLNNELEGCEDCDVDHEPFNRNGHPAEGHSLQQMGK